MSENKSSVMKFAEALFNKKKDSLTPAQRRKLRKRKKRTSDNQMSKFARSANKAFGG